MKSSNPQAEKMLVAAILRDPIFNLAAFVDKAGDQVGAIFSDKSILATYEAIAKIFNHNPDELSDSNLIRLVDSQITREIIQLAHSDEQFSFRAVMLECLNWSAIRATDQMQREYAEWRRNGVEPSKFAEIASVMIDGLRRQTDIAQRHVRTASEIFEDVGTKPFCTGYPLFDTMLHGGWRPGEVNLFAGHTAGGKSMLQANIVAWQVMNQRPALAVQLELSEQRFIDAVVSIMTGVPHDLLDQSRVSQSMELLTSEHVEKIQFAKEQLDALFRINSTAFTVPQIAAWTAVQKERFNADGHTDILLCIDHLNKIHSADPRAQSSAVGGMALEQVAYAISDISHCEHGLGIPIALTAQLEDVSARLIQAKGKLSIEEFKVRGCRAIEHAMTTAWALGKHNKVQGHAVLQKLKDRNGDGADNYPNSVPYNHKTRSFIR